MEIPQIRKLLDCANGARRIRTLSYQELMDVLRRINRHPHEIGEWATLNGGSVANAYGYPAITTIALAVRDEDGSVVLGIKTADANKVTPGRAWPTVSPWRPDFESHRAKRLAWCRKIHPNQVRLILTGDDQVDVVLNTCAALAEAGMA